jgi:hypothetical protein
MITTIKNLFSKIDRKLIVDLVVLLIPIMLIYLYFYLENSPEIKKVNGDNKKIEQKIDAIKSDNDLIMQRIDEFEKNQTVFFDLIDKNNFLIEQNNKELIKLKKAYNDKINNVNGYSVSQLDSFFRNRYKDYYER